MKNCYGCAVAGEPSDYSMHISGRSASRLARPAPPIDRWTSTCGPFSWTDIGSPWPDVARNLSLLAPREAHPGSDVDLLVDFEPGASLLAMSACSRILRNSLALVSTSSRGAPSSLGTTTSAPRP